MNIFKKIYYMIFDNPEYKKCAYEECDNYVSSHAALYFGQDICFTCQKIEYRTKCYDKLWKDYKKIVLPIVLNQKYQDSGDDHFAEHVHIRVNEIVKQLVESHYNEISDLQYETINKLIYDEFGIESKYE